MIKTNEEKDLLTLSLNFWGVQCQIFSSHESDLKHYSYYFKEFLSSKVTHNRIDLLFETEVPDISFIQGLMNPSCEKRMFYRYAGKDWIKWEYFKKQSIRPTLLPPFPLVPLCHKLELFHAACMVKNGYGIAIAGSSYSGKSSMSLELSHRGWSCLTDDILVIDRQSGQALSFQRPIGIRERTILHLPWLRKKIEKNGQFGKSYRLPTGVTHMILFSDLFGYEPPKRAYLKGIVFLKPSQIEAPILNRCSMDESATRLAQVAFERENSDIPSVLRDTPLYELSYDLESGLLQATDKVELLFEE